MGQLLSGGKGATTKISAHDKAVLDLKIQRDKLKQYQKQIQTIVKRELEIARHHIQSGDKRRAALALRKKRFQEQLISKTDEQLMTLESLTQSIEYALVEQQVLQGLKEGTRILQLLNKEMRLDEVEKLMGDTEDAIEYQREVERNLTSNSSDGEDETELLRELEELEQMEVDEEKLRMPAVPVNQLPSTAKVPAEKETFTAAKPKLEAA